MIAQKYQALLAVMQQNNVLYRPSAFWAEASLELVKEFEANGIENFRRLMASLLFFVPTYGFPGNALSEEIVQQLETALEQVNASEKQQEIVSQFTSGYVAALADYRVFMATNGPRPSIEGCVDLRSFSESQVGNPVEQFEFDNHFYSRSALNYLLGLSFLQQYVPLHTINTVLEIGGGFGTLGEIVLKTFNSAQYIDVDIPPTSMVSEYYLQKVFGADQVSTYEDTATLTDIAVNSLQKASVLNSWQIEQLSGDVDLFVNFISFQEMEPEIVQNYLAHVKRLNAKWLLLRNMREGKQLRSQHRFGVETPILTEDYIRMVGGYELVDSNVMPFGYKTVDHFHSEILLFKRCDA
ncbi:putative sugar O-methyltransferase [Hydrogenovibrio sp. SC-1]|uniref:putative sugar O-methyltransferase n=1 Tax=Hydrogenovibrio sp. SC-1 TaxID=2065820 RepID=UPI000C7CF6C2|nr:putative sugar O-methyltransferase [Hydrogenovibrio sp. SC-1]PLA74888.1 putative sugar O-methyltransferase [Hydrogenovibrio sp. SC-1]